MVRNRFVVTALLVCLAANLRAATHEEQIDALLKKFNANRQFNGAALVAEKGNVILKKGYGMANVEWEIPNTPDTKFRLGSITKQFTSMLVMQLVAEGKIKLDEKMTTYLPDYRKDTGDRITVRMLLNHTSGIPSYTSRPDIREISRTPVNVNEFVKKYASGDLEFEPGKKWSYNNSGYFILGAMLERVAGKPYEQQLKERIFDPLGMSSTGYDHRETILPKRASGYVLGPGGYRNAAYLDMSVPFAAGSLYSTVEDLFKWDRALYTDKLLAPEFKTMLWTPGLQHYGFGWLIDTMTLDDEKTKAAFVAHNGGIDGFSTSLVRFPETQDFVVLLDNTSRGDVLDDIGKSIADILHDIDPPAARPSIADEIRGGANVQEMVKRYRELKATKPAAYNFRETELNRVGYELLQSSRAADAIEIFKLNVEMYPKSWNVYDSLAEGYMIHGDRDLALTNYRKSLELNAGNDNAKEMIRRMEKPVAKLAPALLDRYAGAYELAPGFVLTVTHEGDKLFAQATGQPKFELVAESETEFNVSIVNARVTFSTAPDGAVILTLHQGGRDVPAKKK
jgi:CubicO group peptidase (beta-lactamase class C family)